LLTFQEELKAEDRLLRDEVDSLNRVATLPGKPGKPGIIREFFICQ